MRKVGLKVARFSKDLRSFFFCAAAGAAWVAAGPANAGTPIDERIEAKAGGSVRIKNVSGSVKVTASDANEVVVTGTLGDGAKGLHVGKKEGGIVEIEVQLPKKAKNVEDTDLLVSVPKSSHLDIETVSASIEVVGVSGTHDFDSVSGQILLMGFDGDITASSVSGKVEIGNCGGTLKGETTSGALHLFAGRFDSVDVESVSGEVGFDAELSEDGLYDLESHSGRVLVRVSEEDSASFEIQTFSGSIENEFSASVVEERAVPGKTSEFVLGGGSAKVKVSSFSGDVSIGRRKVRG
jgi:DUF4097 and DUF4098 domain-containing protein YvlB